MPTPRYMKYGTTRRPEEVGVSGGAPTEGNPQGEFEVVVVDKYGNRETRVVREISFNAAVGEIARMMYYDIAEEVAKEVLDDLPRPHMWGYIYNLSSERAYKVEVKQKYLTEVIVVPKPKATYYFGGMWIHGVDVYIPIEALYLKKQGITYYNVVRSPTAIDAIKDDLLKFLEGLE